MASLAKVILGITARAVFFGGKEESISNFVSSTAAHEKNKIVWERSGF